jgi:hypothetical protein
MLEPAIWKGGNVEIQLGIVSSKPIKRLSRINCANIGDDSESRAKESPFAGKRGFFIDLMDSTRCDGTTPSVIKWSSR